MSNDKMREEFEAWHSAKFGWPLRHYDFYWNETCYEDEDFQCAWECWQASREALVIELPELHTMAPDDDKKWHGCRNSTIRTCARAIEAAGVKVKP